MRNFRRLLLTLLTHPLATLALTSSAPPRGDAIAPRLANQRCRMQLTVGRVPGSAMPPEWAASGAQLSLSDLVVEFTDRSGAYEMSKERLLGSGTACKRLAPSTQPSFVGRKGTETVRVTEGAYTFELQRIEALRYSLRFCLDFPEGAVRNDVTLPAERVFFSTVCWLDNDSVLDSAEKRYTELEDERDKVAKEMVELKKSSSTGNFFTKAAALRPSILLLERRNSLEEQIEEMRQLYPLQKKKLVQGPNGTLFAKEGYMSVKRYAGALGAQEQYHWVGQFLIKDFMEGSMENTK